MRIGRRNLPAAEPIPVGGRVEGESPMGRSSRDGSPNTRPTWETLEAWVRGKVQEFVQAVLEEEVTEALGRPRYARRDGIDTSVGHRNGYGKPRRLALQSGTIVVRRPRVRGLEERFE